MLREVYNSDSREKVSLRFVQGQALELTDVITGETRTATADEESCVTLEIEKPADFVLLSYKPAAAS